MPAGQTGNRKRGVENVDDGRSPMVRGTKRGRGEDEDDLDLDIELKHLMEKEREEPTKKKRRPMIGRMHADEEEERIRDFPGRTIESGKHPWPPAAARQVCRRSRGCERGDKEYHSE